MSRKYRDITFGEINSICKSNISVGCQNCPLFFKDEFGYEGCLADKPEFIPDNLLEKEIELKGDRGMIKKVEDCTSAELDIICETSANCIDCPLFVLNKFGYKGCLRANPHCATNDMLEIEVEIPKETEE